MEASSESMPTRILLRLPGVEGPSITTVPARYKGWLLCQSVQFGAGLGIGSRRKRDDDADKKKDDDEKGEKKEEESDDENLPSVSEPSISEITLSRNGDSASAAIFANMLSRKAMPIVEVVIIKGESVVSSYTLSQVLISGFSISAAGSSDKPSRRNGRSRSDDGTSSESISLNFSEFTFTSGTDTTGYNLLETTTTFNGKALPDYEGRSESEYEQFELKLKKKGKTLEEARKEAKEKKKARGDYY